MAPQIPKVRSGAADPGPARASRLALSKPPRLRPSLRPSHGTFLLSDALDDPMRVISEWFTSGTGSAGSDPVTRSHRVLLGLVLLAWAMMTIPAFWVLPALDDWGSGIPITPFTWDLLWPTDSRWLPLAHLFRVAEFALPYPGFLHAMNALAHLTAIGLVGLLARQCGGSRRSALLAALACAIAPAVGTAIWSMDSENHVWSNVFGLMSALVLLLGRSNRWRSYVGWLVFAMLSVLWNEGGIAWFAAAPFMKAFAMMSRRSGGERSEAPVSNQDRSHAKQVYLRCGLELALGLVGVSIYFALRFLLLGKVALGTPGARYGIGFNPIAIAKQAAMILGTAASTVDTLALLSLRPRFWWALLSFAMGLPLLFIIGRRAKQDWSVHHWLLAALASLAVVAPFSVMGHVSEMYAQRPAAVLAILLIGANWRRERTVPSRRWGQAAVALAALACVIGNGHKLRAMVRVGETSVAMGRIIADTVGPDVPASLCVVCEQPVGKVGYSVYEGPPGFASWCGLAARMQWGWDRQVAFHIVSTVAECRRSDGPAISLTLSGQVQKLW